MLEDRRHSLTERVTVNFSPAQLERLERYLQRYGENLGGFIRRAALEKLDQLGATRSDDVTALPPKLAESRIENYSLRSSGGK